MPAFPLMNKCQLADERCEIMMKNERVGPWNGVNDTSKFSIAGDITVRSFPSAVVCAAVSLPSSDGITFQIITFHYLCSRSFERNKMKGTSTIVRRRSNVTQHNCAGNSQLNCAFRYLDSACFDRM